MTVITLSRQMGSQGYEVAQAAADLLGFRLVYREMINQAALRSGSPEMALAAIDELGLLGIYPTPKNSRAYREAVAQIMFELESEGNVIIIGRGGQVILQGRPGVLHMRVVAPVEVRAGRVAQRTGVAYECALAQVEASDKFRRSYLKRHYHVNWDDPSLYDLTLNTHRLSIPDAAETIQHFSVHHPFLPIIDHTHQEAVFDG